MQGHDFSSTARHFRHREGGRNSSGAYRRIGYLIAALLGATFWSLLNVAPTWRAIPFLSPAADAVLGLVNAFLVAGIVANLVFLVYDGRWLQETGQLVTNGIALLALVRLWQVFPFDFGVTPQWSVFVRVALVALLIACGIGILAALVRLVTGLVSGTAGRP